MKCSTISDWLDCFLGKDPVTGFVVERSAFKEAFSEQQCFSAWSKIGVAPLTRKCLESKQVRREFGDADDEMNRMEKSMEDANRVSCFFLTQIGYDGSALWVEVAKLKKLTVTVPHSGERIANCTHGGGKNTWAACLCNWRRPCQQ